MASAWRCSSFTSMLHLLFGVRRHALMWAVIAEMCVSALITIANSLK